MKLKLDLPPLSDDHCQMINKYYILLGLTKWILYTAEGGGGGGGGGGERAHYHYVSEWYFKNATECPHGLLHYNDSV